MLEGTVVLAVSNVDPWAELRLQNDNATTQVRPQTLHKPRGKALDLLSNVARIHSHQLLVFRVSLIVLIPEWDEPGQREQESNKDSKKRSRITHGLTVHGGIIDCGPHR